MMYKKTPKQLVVEHLGADQSIAKITEEFKIVLNADHKNFNDAFNRLVRVCRMNSITLAIYRKLFKNSQDGDPVHAICEKLINAEWVRRKQAMRFRIDGIVRKMLKL